MQNSMESACLNKQSEGWTKILALPQKLQIALLQKEKLNPKYIEIPEGGHLNEKSGYTEFPLVLEEAKMMIRV